jgi:hypothetical protein
MVLRHCATGELAVVAQRQNQSNTLCHPSLPFTHAYEYCGVKLFRQVLSLARLPVLSDTDLRLVQL